MYSRTSKKTILGTEAECVGSVCFGQGKGDIYVRGGFWLFRIRPKRQAGVNYRGSKGVLGSWFRKKVLQIVIDRKRREGTLEEGMSGSSRTN